MTDRRGLGRFIPLVAAALMLSLSESAAATQTHDTEVVVTDRGPVKGEASSEVRAFRGIPYAAPPTRELRWQPPAATARWTDVRDAAQFANNCPQFGTPFGLESLDEDCLYLNVFAPPAQRKSRSFPVMVWFHPGAFQFGESDDYDPGELVHRGIVVVTVNYRLGALGFLAHPALSAQTSYSGSGNYGLMDLQAALRWVKRNISRFGGNPDNVTIFGESAGGLSVHAHLTSPLSRGLFHRAIAQSGAYTLNLPTLAVAEAEGTAYATAVGCSAQGLDCLRSVPVPVLLANQRPGALGYLPNIDGRVLPQSIGDAFGSGRFNRVPVIEGSTHDEFRLFIPLFFDFVNGPVKPEDYPTAVAILLGVPPVSVPSIVAQYPLSSYPSPNVALAAMSTDRVFACNMQTAAQLLSQYVPTWVYEFSDADAPQRYLPAASFPYGAYHESEIQYLFDIVTTLPAQPLSEQQERLSRAMMGYWTYHAYLGNPNGLTSTPWIRYTLQSDSFLSLVSPRPQLYAGTAFADDHKCAFWGQFGAQ